jgi:hypothetical protein
MPIKYAEITITINTEKETMSNYFSRILLGDENTITDNDSIIILFDDGIICDVKKEYNTKLNKNIIIGPRGFQTNVPMYFEIEDIKKTFFSKKPRVEYQQIFLSKSPIVNYKILKLDARQIFANSEIFLTSTKEPSIYNSIYYMIKNIDTVENIDVLAISKIKSSEIKPRFLLAYDDEFFKKDNIIYFINEYFL